MDSSIVAIVAAVISVIGALIAGYLASRSSERLARDRRREERRAFCMHLQQQFDSPEFFRCRYNAWKKLNSGEFDGIRKLSELLEGEHWTHEVSTTVHFFDSLNRYCEEDLIDQVLAVKLFGRSYEMWWQRVFSQIQIDKEAQSYKSWFTAVCGFHDRIVSSTHIGALTTDVAKHVAANNALELTNEN